MAKKSSKSKSETEPSKRKRNRTPSADLDNQQESSKKAMNEKITIAGASDEFRNPLQPSSEEKAALERLFSKVKPSGGLSPDWKGDEGKNKPTSPPRGRKKVARPVGANGTIKLVPVEESPRPSTSPSEPKATTDGPTAAEKEAINKASKRKESEESEGTGNRDNKKQKPFAENDNKRKEADHADTASTRRTGKKQKSAAQEKSKKRKETESDGSQSDSSTSNKKSKPTVEKSIEKRKDSGDSAAESNKDKKQKKTSTADNDAFIEKESRRSKLKRKMAETDFPDRFDNEDEEPKQEPEEKQDEKADSGKPLHRFIVFIGNLPYTTTVASLTKHLEALKPSSVRVPTDKKDSSKAKGFAFVEFKDASRMKSCLKLFHHTIFEGRKINVELTAGGGGSNASRKRKLADKNERLNAERKRRYEEEEAERDSKRAATEKKDDVDAAAPSAVHPSRMKRIRK